MTKQDWIDKGAWEFLSGNHILFYNENYRVWQYKYSAMGDKAIREFLFGSVFPGYEKIRDYQKHLLKNDWSLDSRHETMAQFKQSGIYKQLLETIK